jgi:transcriptional regulator with XRE-family HTH domain
MNPIAMRIRRARVLSNISQGELARKVGVKRSAVTQWEREGGTHPSVEHLSMIAVVTQVSFEWLATGRGVAGRNVDLKMPDVVSEVALDDVEVRAVALLRRLPVRKRQAVCAILEMLA